MAEQLRVMISSTARDLPEHRKEAMDACLRQGMFPIMMEHLAAMDDEAIPASLKMVDESDIYLLVLAHRYGYVPAANNPAQTSVTEHEYNRAVERKIPILTFVMHEDHPVKAADVEKGEGAAKLEVFKNRALLKVANSFRSPAELRANVIDSLSHHRRKGPKAFHYISDIPESPGVYVAHPYTLLQTPNLIGRKAELKFLTDWITGKELEFGRSKAPADSVRLMNIVAIGGMGKSGLTWKWFNDVAPQEVNDLGGRMWWSFYESDATFDNFVTRALAYVSRRPLNHVEQIPAPERETQLLATLNREPFLVVLDGLERILIAYARMDAARLSDNEIGTERTARKTADPRVGRFLRKLVQVRRSRFLISSRLYPAELEIAGGGPLPGAFRLKLEGLTDEDAVELWQAFEVSGSHQELLPVLNSFGKHPLLIQALAGEVKRYRKAPGNFLEWQKANPEFSPTQFGVLKDAMGHVLEYALIGLENKAEAVLRMLAAFRMPTSYDTLKAVLVGNQKTCATESELDEILTELEERGLVGWDKRANRYDLHPIVRGVVWNSMTAKVQRGVYQSLQVHFELSPTANQRQEISSFEDLSPVIELYNTLIGLKRYDEAFDLFTARIYKTALDKLSASRQCAELLELLFTNQLDWTSHLKARGRRAASLTLLALAYDWSGRPGRSKALYLSAIGLYEQSGSQPDVCADRASLASALQLMGRLREAESEARAALKIARRLSFTFVQATSLFWLGLTMSARGQTDEAGWALSRAINIARAVGLKPEQGAGCAFLSQHLTQLGDFDRARRNLETAWAVARNESFRRLYARVARRHGALALASGDLETADEHLHTALKRAQPLNFAEEEIPALIGLAELHRRREEMKTSRELLEDIWEAADRGPYPLFQTDALNVLAQIERDEGNHAAAIEAATKAYQLAWGDGPPFAYHWGLEKAKQHLKELGAPEPLMPQFDESKFEPMPEVEINPRDEFYVDEADLSN